MKSKLAYYRESRIRHLDRSVLIEFEDGFEEVKGLFVVRRKRDRK
ncbi:hypothetical protein sp82g_206 [Bacillus phage SP82G]|nr:hypothetical protein sp82g_206 [Bacillus phage SP82G]